MKEIQEHQVVHRRNVAVIKGMAAALYWVDGAYFREKMDEWREAFEHICDEGAFEMLQDELGRLFNGGKEGGRKP